MEFTNLFQKELASNVKIIDMKRGLAVAKSKRNKTIDFEPEDAPVGLKEQLLDDHNDLSDLSTIIDHQIVGDSFKIMPRLPRHCVDLALVDPPYNLTKHYDGLHFSHRSQQAYQEFTKQWIQALLPLLKESATIYVFADWQTSIPLAPLLSQNFIIKNRITWQREKGRGAKTNWKNGDEDIWFPTRQRHGYTFNVNDVKMRRRVIAPYRVNGQAKDWHEGSAGRFRDTYPSNFWDDISIPYWSMPENTAHPTQKPEKLLAKTILASSNPGDLVFDPFSGSGSSLVTARKLGRHYLGIEQSLRYALWGQYRLQKASTNHRIQGYTDGVFWERNTLEWQKARHRS